MSPLARARAAALALALTLAGCAGTPPPPGVDPVPAELGPPIPTATGIDIPGSGREIGFGRHLPGAEAALARLYGAPARRPCAGGTVLALGALELHFEGESFAGWRQGGRSAGRLCGL